MISGLEIKGFRGIREGKVENLTPLVILVGPNGGGKSTILDALLIGASPSPGDSVGRAVRRHPGTKEGHRWLLFRGGSIEACRIHVSSQPDTRRRIELIPSNNVSDLVCKVDEESNTGYFILGEVQIRFGNDNLYGVVQTSGNPNRPLADVPEVRLIEPFENNPQTPLNTLYSRVVSQGRRENMLEIMRPVVPGLSHLEILTERDGQSPILHFVFSKYSVPVALAGDGVHTLTRLCLELAVGPRGIVLLEEPEIHQHPGAIRQSAKAIIAAMRSDIQVVLTTHSLELIDALLDESSPEELKEKVSLYRVVLRDGELKSHRHTGEEAIFARSQIEDDLR